MSEEQKRILERQLWNIADTLRGKMGADEFRDYMLGFIFYKYLSEKMHLYGDEILKNDGYTYLELDESSEEHRIDLEAVKEAAIGDAEVNGG
ncbi:MAG: hypothetical protein GY757_51115 [bacterium]|nr:hypothetical protein [bacterium]